MNLKPAGALAVFLVEEYIVFYEDSTCAIIVYVNTLYLGTYQA